MRIARFVLTSALLLATSLTAHAFGARVAEQSASGSYQFTLGDRYVKYVKFDAHALADGTASGDMYLSDEAPVNVWDVDNTGEPGETLKGFYLSAALDGLTVSGNRAVMSGTVRDSSIKELLGRRVLLTVEDNGDNSKEPDRLTWGIYNPSNRDWKPSDAELKDDPGVGLTWWATDAEVKDDPGYKMPRDDSFNTQTYPVAAYAYADAVEGAGDILVQP